MKAILSTLLIALLLTSGCLNGENQPNPPINPPANQTSSPHGIYQEWATTHQTTLEEATLFFKKNYGLENENDIFAQLPPPPENIDMFNTFWGGGDANTLRDIPEETILQPTFYPTFQQTGKRPWTNATGEWPSTTGTMSTPAEQEITIPPEETLMEATLLVGSTWGATYYQGAGITYTLQPETPHQLTITPSSILLGPTFPAFSPEWMKRITIQGTITPTPGVEKYTLTLFSTTPHPDSEQQWMAQYAPYIRTDGTYTDPNGLATLTIRVHEE